MRFFLCLFTEHDLWLVALAAVICAFGGWVTMRLCVRAHDSDHMARPSWIFLGSVAAGSTVWCTHFVAMLAYRPGVPVSYDPELTGISLLVAIVSAAASLAVVCSRWPFAAEIGGGLFGAGVVAMHYTGMTAFAADGIMFWDGAYVAASVVLSVLFSASAFGAVIRTDGMLKRQVLGTVLLVSAIVALHFTAMAAINILPTAPEAGAPTSNDAYDALAIAVAGVGLLVLGTGLASYLLDQQADLRSKAQTRQILESSVDGVVIEAAGRIHDVNAAFTRLFDGERATIIGRTFQDLISGPAPIVEQLVRSWLLTSDGRKIPVEITAREGRDDKAGRGTRVYSLRDLRLRIAHEERIAHLASFDSLTGLPNRPSFLEHLERQIEAKSDSAKIAFLAIDLDRFKEVNDIHGHAAGDHVLSALAGRMRTAVGEAGYLARLGGDEFAVIAVVQSREEAISLATRLERELFAPIPYEHADLTCGAAIGIAFYPEDADSLATLMNNADLAMYRAKESHSDAICFYEEAMDERVRLRRSMAFDLRVALANQQFYLVYQPQFAIGSNEITGYEALLRWRHPERGNISPGEFIPIAEDTGIILQIGEWVLHSACAAAALWDRPHRVAVNLSALQLNSAELPYIVRDILRETGLPSARLEVEITETSVIQDTERTLHILGQLKALGVTVAMDDFGTGYSSLSTLRAFPFDKIKLDKSFMEDLERGPQARAMLRAVIALGDSLQIPVLAEGVETEAQLEFLAQQGCAEVQGFLLGRPSETVSNAPTKTKIAS